jgi:hypothetical protein
MMINARFILFLLALLCFFAAAVEIQTPRVNLTATGLLLLTLGFLLT